mgnify:CR=1 FL=1
MARKLTLIEFTKATATRSVGSRLRVDDMSAVSLVDKKKVAIRVDEGVPSVETAPAPDPEPRKPRRAKADEPEPAEPDGE